VTACHEVGELAHPLAKFLVYGRFDRVGGSFAFDHRRIERLWSYDAAVDPMCSECFARFYCAGDCLAKCLGEDGKRNMPTLNPRCKVNQELAKHYVFSTLIGAERGDEYERARSNY
jgi:uncharacterized protein